MPLEWPNLKWDDNIKLISHKYGVGMCTRIGVITVPRSYELSNKPWKLHFDDLNQRFLFEKYLTVTSFLLQLELWIWVSISWSVASYWCLGKTDQSHLKKSTLPLNMRPIGYPQTLLTTNQRCVTSQKREYLINSVVQ